MKIIYDVGAGNGEDLSYYLMKSDLVVAIDANPACIQEIRTRFRSEIAQHRLIAIHCAIDSSTNEIEFNINTKMSAISRRVVVDSEVSQFGDAGTSAAWETVRVPSAKLSDLIKVHGQPFAIKMDIEGAEDIALADLFSCGLRPQYLSVELGYNFHTCLCYLYLMGYRRFQMVNMARVHKLFRFWPIKLRNESTSDYNFLHWSSGPLGDDLPEDWLDFERFCFSFSSRYMTHGDSQNWSDNWWDVHATL